MMAWLSEVKWGACENSWFMKISGSECPKIVGKCQEFMKGEKMPARFSEKETLVNPEYAGEKQIN